MLRSVNADARLLFLPACVVGPLAAGALVGGPANRLCVGQRSADRRSAGREMGHLGPFRCQRCQRCPARPFGGPSANKASTIIVRQIDAIAVITPGARYRGLTREPLQVAWSADA